MRNDNKLEYEEVDIYERELQNLLSLVLCDPVVGLKYICEIDTSARPMPEKLQLVGSNVTKNPGIT